MTVTEMLLPEFDEETRKTRTYLERLPENKADYKPHEKSMPLGRLAAHIAQLPELAALVAELPSLDFATSSMKPLVLESRQQLLADFDRIAQRARQSISAVPEKDWQRLWKLSFGGKTITEESRYQVYRKMFLNHLVHHRAQLGVYLRLNGVPVPATYGPSADDTMGF